MSPAGWRALISAFLEGRLSAAAFCKRFSEAFELVVRERRPVPQRVQDLYFVVEAYGGDPMGRGHDVSDDRDLRAAAAAALAALPEAVDSEPVGADAGVPTPDLVILREPPPGGGPRREEVRREVRRAAFTLGAVGVAGCLLGLAWIAVGILQFFAASAQIDAWLRLGPAPSAILGLLVAFTPILGSVVAFLGATSVWGWANWAAAIVFLLAPALTLIGGIDRWRRWRRH
jgi:hypothetical protein